MAALAGNPGLQVTLGLIKPTVCSYQPDVSAVLRHIKTNNPDLMVVRQKRLFWKTEEAEAFYAEHKGRFYYDRLIAGMTRFDVFLLSLCRPRMLMYALPLYSFSGPSMALALAGPNAIQEWRAMLGPTKAYRYGRGFGCLMYIRG